jgi:hypothetical protein
MKIFYLIFSKFQGLSLRLGFCKFLNWCFFKFYLNPISFGSQFFIYYSYTIREPTCCTMVTVARLKLLHPIIYSTLLHDPDHDNFTFPEIEVKPAQILPTVSIMTHSSTFNEWTTPTESAVLDIEYSSYSRQINKIAVLRANLHRNSKLKNIPPSSLRFFLLKTPIRI